MCIEKKGEQIRGYKEKNTGKIRGKLKLSIPPARRVWRWGPFFRRTHDGRGWHGREPATVPFALGKEKVVIELY